MSRSIMKTQKILPDTISVFIGGKLKVSQHNFPGR